MLTSEAERRRLWGGLLHLAEALEPRRAEFESHIYPLSISDSESDEMRRIAYIAELVLRNKHQLLMHISEPGEPASKLDRHRSINEDLEELEKRLGWLQSRASDLREGMQKVRREVDSLSGHEYGNSATGSGEQGT